MLEKGERSILSYFPSSTKAEKAFQELKEAGIPIDEGSMQIDRISRYDMRINDEINNPKRGYFVFQQFRRGGSQSFTSRF